MDLFRRTSITRAAAWALGLGSVFFASQAAGQQPRAAAQRGAPEVPHLACRSVQTGEALRLVMGKSQLVRLPAPAIRLIGGGGRGSSTTSLATTPSAPGQAGPVPARAAQSAGSSGVADIEVTLLSPTELLIVGRRPGSANVIVQDEAGRCEVRDITITADPGTLQAKLHELLPHERDVRIAAAGDSMVLTGSVSDAVTLDQIITVAHAYGDDKKLVNLLRVTAPQQVMLEVKIAEVSKGLLDRLGLDFSRMVAGGDRTNIISGILGGNPGVLGRFGPPGGQTFGSQFSGSVSNSTAAAIAGTGAGGALPTRAATLLGLNAEDRDGIVRLLAEPNIMAISGQAASFLSGGKIFIPVAQSNGGGGTVITLEEKEFGVGLKFTPTVLDGRINLKVVSEVSELSQTGSPFSTVGGVTSVIPSLSTRRVDTTVQLADGQSFAVAGLIRENYAGALKKFPGLGETPVLGALFRSTEFQNDQTELLFVITPRLVKPMTGRVQLPTDALGVPSRADMLLRGKGESSIAPTLPTVPAPQPAVQRPMSALPQDAVVTVAAAPAREVPAGRPLPPLASTGPDAQPYFE